MAQGYLDIVVETYRSVNRGKHGDIRVRPVPGQFYPPSLNVECSKSMREQHPVGTKFKIRVKLTDRDGGQFLYSHHAWPFEVIA